MYLFIKDAKTQMLGVSGLDQEGEAGGGASEDEEKEKEQKSLMQVRRL